MSEKMMYLEIIQANARRYGWQSFLLKILTMFAATLFIVADMVSPAGLHHSGISLVVTFMIVLCILAWLLDGHFSYMQENYVELYRDAAAVNAEDFKMKLEMPSKVNVKALWRPMVFGVYSPVMLFLILIGLSLHI